MKYNIQISIMEAADNDEANIFIQHHSLQYHKIVDNWQGVEKFLNKVANLVAENNYLDV